MDRTVKLNDMWFFREGGKNVSFFEKHFAEKKNLPVKSDKPFVICRKIICPKQVNDTVTVYFAGEYENLRVFADKTQLSSVINKDGKEVYDITASLKKGVFYLSVNADKGKIDDFFLSVKRNIKEKTE